MIMSPLVEFKALFMVTSAPDCERALSQVISVCDIVFGMHYI